MKRMRFLSVLLLLLLIVLVGGEPGADPVAGDLLQDLKNGVRMAGKLFGIETISDVAKQVAKGFSRQGFLLEPEANTPLQQRAATMMVLIWRLIGLDGGKLGALIVNALIFVAHMIAINLEAFRKPGLQQNIYNSYSNPAKLDDLQLESPLHWLLNNQPKKFRSTLESIHSDNHTSYLESNLDSFSHSMSEDSDCVKLLICQIQPFVVKMQQVVRKQFELFQDSSEPPKKLEDIVETVYRNVPTLKDFEASRVQCEARFTRCTFFA